MARPRQFDDQQALNAAMQQFWTNGFEVTTIRDIANSTGLSLPSLYNAFGDKRALFDQALKHYHETQTLVRVERLSKLPPREAITAFFEEVIQRAALPKTRRGCFLVNSAMEVSPEDDERTTLIREAVETYENFFLAQVERAKASGAIKNPSSSRDLARMLMALFFGLRVVIRFNTDRKFLYDIVTPAFAMLFGEAPGKHSNKTSKARKASDD